MAYDRVRLDGARVKGARADFVKAVVTVTITVPLNEASLEARKALAYLAVSEDVVTVEVGSGVTQLEFKA